MNVREIMLIIFHDDEHLLQKTILQTPTHQPLQLIMSAHSDLTVT